MTDGIEPERGRHCAVHLDHYIIIFGGILSNSRRTVSTHVIWSYNLYMEKWRNYAILETGEAPDELTNAVADTINGTIYAFCGQVLNKEYLTVSNELWTLNRSKSGHFTWSYIKPQYKDQSPSPRSGHTGWAYGRKLWIFGGAGPSPEGYLNVNGDIAHANVLALVGNNQLLCYDPNTQKWTNPQCFGDAPSPRTCHASTTIKNKVWLFGGYDCRSRQLVDDLFELTMPSLTWTQIQTAQSCPQGRHSCTLTALTKDQLALHGGICDSEEALDDVWIMDLQSHSWRLYTSGQGYSRHSHTGSSGLSSSVIIVGGGYVMDHNVFHVALEPKLLQQLYS